VEVRDRLIANLATGAFHSLIVANMVRLTNANGRVVCAARSKRQHKVAAVGKVAMA
jgi:hypothetical protein